MTSWDSWPDAWAPGPPPPHGLERARQPPRAPPPGCPSTWMTLHLDAPPWEPLPRGGAKGTGRPKAGYSVHRQGPRNDPPATGPRAKAAARPGPRREDGGAGERRSGGERAGREDDGGKATFNLNQGACSAAATSSESRLGPSALQTIETAAPVERRRLPRARLRPKERRRRNLPLMKSWGWKKREAARGPKSL